MRGAFWLRGTSQKLRFKVVHDNTPFQCLTGRVSLPGGYIIAQNGKIFYGLRNFLPNHFLKEGLGMIPPNRIKELLAHFWAESANPETYKWRDDLTEEEKERVAKWDALISKGVIDTDQYQ